MANAKVTLNGTTLMDITDTTAESGDVLEGQVFYAANGTRSVGSMDLSTYAPLASPAFTGTPTAPTASSGTDTTQIATTAFVQDAISGVGTVTKVTAGTGLTGGDITTTGTIALDTSGVTAGSAGPTADVNGNNNVTISVPRLTVDSYGRVTELTSYTLTNKNVYGTAVSTSSGSNAAKGASCYTYSANANSYVYIEFTSSNTAQSAITLKINNENTYPIYINGESSSSTNYTLPAGAYLAYFDGTNYYFRTDGALPTGGVSVSEKAKMVYNSSTDTIDFIFS